MDCAEPHVIGSGSHRTDRRRTVNGFRAARMRDCAGEQAGAAWRRRRRARRSRVRRVATSLARTRAPDPTDPGIEAAAVPDAAPPGRAVRPETGHAARAPRDPTTARDRPDAVEPDRRRCPVTHPIKAKLSSGIYHRPARSRTSAPAPTVATATTAAADRRPPRGQALSARSLSIAARGRTLPRPRHEERSMSDLWNDFKKFLMQGDLVAIAGRVACSRHAFKAVVDSVRRRRHHADHRCASSVRPTSTTSRSSIGDVRIGYGSRSSTRSSTS